MPKYPWKPYSPLRTHDFDEGLALEGGDLFVCKTCGRRFKFNREAHRTWAVGDGKGYLPLQDSVSSRWIAEPCSGGPNARDVQDSKRVKTRAA